jgi:UDP-glucuronate 4-epimerase
MINRMKKVLVTGAAGFIGAKTTEMLLTSGVEVVGVDNLNNYYDVALKNERLSSLKSTGFTFIELDIENKSQLDSVFEKHQFDVVFNLAARAGVRYSMENPHVYMTTNALGTLNLLECMKDKKVNKFVLASTSSLYAGQPMPFKEELPVNTPISPYAASKKAAEVMAYTYHYLYGIDVTVVRYFTVYGPAGRPDMSPMLFTKAILANEPIQVFNHGDMMRDFTYIDDVTESVKETLFKSATPNANFDAKNPDPASSHAPYRIFNIGNSQPVPLMQFIETLEEALGKKAIKKMMDMQAGDVKETSADTSELNRWVKFKPNTSIKEGVKRFVDWYKIYY